jgi:hypothetical protein
MSVTPKVSVGVSQITDMFRRSMGNNPFTFGAGDRDNQSYEEKSKLSKTLGMPMTNNSYECELPVGVEGDLAEHPNL